MQRERYSLSVGGYSIVNVGILDVLVTTNECREPSCDGIEQGNKRAECTFDVRGGASHPKTPGLCVAETIGLGHDLSEHEDEETHGQGRHNDSEARRDEPSNEYGNDTGDGDGNELLPTKIVTRSRCGFARSSWRVRLSGDPSAATD